MSATSSHQDEPTVRLESDYLQVDVAPGVGGRVVSLIHKETGYEFLWHNQRLKLQRLAPGSEYDPNFYGGIDELLPNDIPEVIDGVSCPDHGELWTTALQCSKNGNRLKLSGVLPVFGLNYEREMALRKDGPWLDLRYRITNVSDKEKHFLWKLHAAVKVEPGDLIECPARKAQVVDLTYSRYKTLTPFPWPKIEGKEAHVVPAQDGTTDFFYLYELKEGRMTLRRAKDNLSFAYQFDAKVFPYCWLFASYGGFNGHYTVILEPCTTIPISVNEAAKKKQCSFLQPGEVLETKVSIWAGADIKL